MNRKAKTALVTAGVVLALAGCRSIPAGAVINPPGIAAGSDSTPQFWRDQDR